MIDAKTTVSLQPTGKSLIMQVHGDYNRTGRPQSRSTQTMHAYIQDNFGKTWIVNYQSHTGYWVSNFFNSARVATSG
jgi:hypothetical protein